MDIARWEIKFSLRPDDVSEGKEWLRRVQELGLKVDFSAEILKLVINQKEDFWERICSRLVDNATKEKEIRYIIENQDTLLSILDQEENRDLLYKLQSMQF